MRFTRALRTTQILVKSTTGNPTGITGIHQHPNARPALIELYRSTIDLLTHESPQIPDSSVYKQSVLEFTNARLEVAEKADTIQDIEQKIGNGLIEELLIQAGDEYKLAELLIQQKAWEKLEQKSPVDQWVYFGKQI